MIGGGGYSAVTVAASTFNILYLVYSFFSLALPLLFLLSVSGFYISLFLFLALPPLLFSRSADGVNGVRYSVYTIYTKVCGHPFKLVDSAISATTVADKCIKSSHTAMQSP